MTHSTSQSTLLQRRHCWWRAACSCIADILAQLLTGVLSGTTLTSSTSVFSVASHSTAALAPRILEKAKGPRNNNFHNQKQKPSRNVTSPTKCAQAQIRTSTRGTRSKHAQHALHTNAHSHSPTNPPHPPPNSFSRKSLTPTCQKENHSKRLYFFQLQHTMRESQVKLNLTQSLFCGQCCSTSRSSRVAALHQVTSSWRFFTGANSVPHELPKHTLIAQRDVGVWMKRAAAFNTSSLAIADDQRKRCLHEGVHIREKDSHMQAQQEARQRHIHDKSKEFPTRSHRRNVTQRHRHARLPYGIRIGVNKPYRC